MKYNYIYDEGFMRDEEMVSIRDLGKKDKKTKKPAIIVNSHEEMVRLLKEASENAPVNPRALDAIERFPRTDFFNWEDVPEDIKEQVVTPYCFMAPVFAEGQTSGLENVTILQGKEGIMGYPVLVPFDRMATTLAVYRAEKLEELLAQLDVGGLLRVPIPNYGNTPNRNDSRVWSPNMGDIREEDMYFAVPDKGFARVTAFIFGKKGLSDIVYDYSKKPSLAPLME